MEHIPLSSSENSTPNLSPVPRQPKGLPAMLLALTLLSGFVGGLLAPKAEQYLGKYLPESLRQETLPPVAPLMTNEVR